MPFSATDHPETERAGSLISISRWAGLPNSDVLARTFFSAEQEPTVHGTHLPEDSHRLVTIVTNHIVFGCSLHTFRLNQRAKRRGSPAIIVLMSEAEKLIF